MNLIATQPPALPQFELPTGNGEARAVAKNVHQRVSRTHICVREAACRLNMSRSRVYRLDRNNGPFPIVKIGRRVWIELAGLEAFIARKQNVFAAIDPESLASPCIDEAQTSPGIEDQQGSSVECEVPAVTATAPFVDLPRVAPLLSVQGTSRGQGDLQFNWVY